MFSLLFAFYFVQSKKLFNFLSKDNITIEPGETELDYISEEEIVKKKRIYKKKTEPHIVHPKVKTKKK